MWGLEDFRQQQVATRHLPFSIRQRTVADEFAAVRMPGHPPNLPITLRKSQLTGSRRFTTIRRLEMPTSPENQLELFDGGYQPIRPPHREVLGRFLLQLRHDQLVLAGIAGLIGLTVVFACGVERGLFILRE